MVTGVEAFGGSEKALHVLQFLQQAVGYGWKVLKIQRYRNLFFGISRLSTTTAIGKFHRFLQILRAVKI